MPKSNKRAAPTTTTRTKRLRAEVHPLQEKLAERTAAKVRQSRDSAGIIIATRMGTGKPRIVGKVLDRIVPEKIDALDEDEDTYDVVYEDGDTEDFIERDQILSLHYKHPAPKVTPT